jgi:nucleotide-binding universal stress UspA family protein
MSETFIRQAQDAARANVGEHLSKLADKMNKSGMVVSRVVLEGNPAETILDYAEKNGVDLIIMATHGRTGIPRFALGSVADKVVRSSSVPVRVVAPAGCRAAV